MRRVTRRTARAFPTPPVAFSGGARERLFFAPPPPAPLRRWATERFARLDRPLDPAREGALARALGPLLAGRAGGGGLNATKLGLIRWRAGLRFNGGAHKVDAALPLSESIAVFLHYAFTRGRAGMEYIASRGQHAARGGYYRRMLAAEEALARSPLCPASRRYDGPASLAGLARDIPQAARG